MRAIFYLRTLGGSENVRALCAALRKPEGTALFRHEIAYVLGQMQDASAVPDLLAVLRDTSDDTVVRHEVRGEEVAPPHTHTSSTHTHTHARTLSRPNSSRTLAHPPFFYLSAQCAEALGAIADPATLPDLDAFTSDARAEVAETCTIAARRVRWVLEQASPAAAKRDENNPYHSVDPAPAARVIAPAEVPALAAQLVDGALPLFERYKAMFSLRNAGSRAAVLALCDGFRDPSPLFRHEVAYVLGQLQHKASIPALVERTRDEGEHEMVRHEAAEALGAIGTGECVEVLGAYTGAECPTMLRESCVVAMDAADYWAGGGGGGGEEGGAAAVAGAC